MQGVFVDEEGFVLEGPNSNFAIVTEDNVFVTPPFNRCVAGITIQKLMQLIPAVGAYWKAGQEGTGQKHTKQKWSVVFNGLQRLN